MLIDVWSISNYNVKLRNLEEEEVEDAGAGSLSYVLNSVPYMYV